MRNYYMDIEQCIQRDGLGGFIDEDFEPPVGWIISDVETDDGWDYE